MQSLIGREYIESIFEEWFNNLLNGEETSAIEACLNIVRNAPILAWLDDSLVLKEKDIK